MKAQNSNLRTHRGGIRLFCCHLYQYLISTHYKKFHKTFPYLFYISTKNYKNYTNPSGLISFLHTSMFRYNAQNQWLFNLINMTLTVEEFRQALPDKMKKSVNQDLIDQINKTLSNPEEYENYRNNLVGYTSVMKDGKFKIEQYLDAVRYVSFKLLGASNIEAYTKTFPDKYASFVEQGVSSKDIASYVSAYNKGKLVNLIFEQTLVPVHVLNMDMYQRALNEQMVLGLTAKSEKVRADALNSVMVQLRPPDIKKFELDVSVQEDQSLNVLKNSMMELVAEQRRALEAGVFTAQEVAHQKLEYVDVEAKEVK